ncbi:MAG TPA: SDR family NAD(P)-dependent oxidoreductase, partial [Rhodothermales bacterium]|nr:SDR family NAD(P)-dependent oxidoreductase [Rhodothermales bacterium]
MTHRSIALVTGASAGIGEATARHLAAAGYRVIVSARSAERLRALAAHLDGAHGAGTAHVLPFDVTDAAAHAEAIAGLPADWAAIDVAVLNAGLALNMVPVWENTVEEIDRMVDTNVKGVLYGFRAVVPGMLARRRGHIVTLGSIAGHGVYPGGAIYCATKHALLALTEGLKLDLHGTPLRVSTVSPGLTETEFSLVRFEGDAARAAPVYADTIPLTADDVAAAILYVVQAPPHVNVSEVVMRPRVQSGLTAIARGAAAEPFRKGAEP